MGASGLSMGGARGTGARSLSALRASQVFQLLFATQKRKRQTTSHTHTMAQMLDKWAVTMALGGKPVVNTGGSSFPALSAPDGKHTIVVLAHQIRVYFLQTRQCIRTVNVDLSQVIGVYLDPSNDSQIVVFTDTEVKHINWREKVEQVVVATQTILPPIPGLCDVFSVGKDHYFAAARTGTDFTLYEIERESARSEALFSRTGVVAHAVSDDWLALALETAVELYPLGENVRENTETEKIETKTETKKTKTEAKKKAETKAETKKAETKAETKKKAETKTEGEAESKKNQTDGNKKGSGCNNGSGCKNIYSAPLHVLPHTARPITAMAVGNDAAVALGTRSGSILLVRPAAAPRTLRWHMEAVRAVEFSRDGAYLVSGGSEKVLVFWHLVLDNTQFLPRLGGAIDRIHVDARRPDLYLLALRIEDGHGTPLHEVVVVLGVDLESRLAVSPVRPAYAVAVRKVTARARRKWSKGVDGLVVAHDITAPAIVHPTTRHLYFARGSAIQAFDLVRGEQAFVQHATPQIAMGRVRSEHKLVDPNVLHVAFSPDGDWMATFDSMPALSHDNLMLKHDEAHALKFWRTTPRGWELALKIVDPHGTTRVGALVAGPHAGADASFVTVDVRGGIRVWRPRAALDARAAQTVWTLRRATASGAPAASVAACFSTDASVLVVAHGGVSTARDPQLLAPLPLALPACDLPVELLALVGVYLVIASATRLVLFDMVRGRVTALAARVSSPGAGNLMAVDATRNLVAMACNTLVATPEPEIRGKILVFHPDSLEPVHVAQHSTGVASVVATPLGFVFVDTEARAGVLAPVAKALEAPEADLAAQMEAMLVGARAAANMMYTRTAETRTLDAAAEKGPWTGHALVDVASLQPVFANTDGMGMDTLFERVVRALH